MGVEIKSFTKVTPMVYAYTTPGVAYHDGWIKIGYTEKQSVEQRIWQQTHTAGIKAQEEWRDNAMFKDGSGEYFTDHDFHDFLESIKVEREQGTEWFRMGAMESLKLFSRFARRDAYAKEGCSYVLRREQADFVEATSKAFNGGTEKFLWNAKPRFGKTLTTYDLIQRCGYENVLIVTNRPAIANSWANDFMKFVGWKRKYCFVSETEALAGKPGVMSRQEYTDYIGRLPENETPGMIAFESLQGLKGSVYFGGQYDKLEWLCAKHRDGEGKIHYGIHFDLLVVDESQEGVSTMKTEKAFENIDRDHTLYLSGTPFKQLASNDFNESEIKNWSYADEQEAKQNFPEGEKDNPYETLPQLKLFTYQISNMIYDEVQKGLDLSGEEGKIDYAFDLNEFFATNEMGQFIHKDEVKRFLIALYTQEKYPFSTEELRTELSHTLWLMDRVNSCKALYKMLSEDPVFKEYEVVLAAGDGKVDDDDPAENDKAYDRVKDAIAHHDKTITLSVGQLTVGVTIPEWSGVLMLCNLKSASSYMQAAFRAQNPCMMKRNGGFFRKENAYIFDFDPSRTLQIYDEFANNLTRDTVNGGGTLDERKDKVKRLINFFPVIGEDDEGKMIELDAAQVLTIPNKLRSEEVVRHGFMSNFLFQNIGNIFGAPSVVSKILEKMGTADEEKTVKPKEDPLDKKDDIEIDGNGNAVPKEEIVIGRTQDLFGPKVYEELEIQTGEAVDDVTNAETPDEITQKLDTLKETLIDTVKEKVVGKVAEGYELKPTRKKRLENEVSREIGRKFDKAKSDFEQTTNVARVERDKRIASATNKAEVENANEEYQKTIDEAMDTLKTAVHETAKDTIEKKPEEVVRKLEQEKAQKEKESVEDSVRAHLRSFARTIPSFLMAYGDGKVTLANFDDYTEDDVFEEVTGITEEQFRFLRDGGDYEEDGETKHFNGHVFNEVLLNDSMNNFWAKKERLANYFDDNQTEDIFDYIPPQKTNQIFTPKWVVKKMVDMLEQENPGCFDDPDQTFADLYMKSGMYITEVVKRLYRSKTLREVFPDHKERIEYILSTQVYGMAPTRIIYLIATNFIFGFDDELRKKTTHFVQCDAAEASKNGTLKEMVEKYFG